MTLSWIKFFCMFDEHSRFLLIACISIGKKKRLTFIECSNDINMMIDIAKIADLVSYDYLFWNPYKDCLFFLCLKICNTFTNYLTLNLGFAVDRCQVWFWDGNIWVLKHMSSAWNATFNGCLDSSGFVQEQEDLAKNKNNIEEALSLRNSQSMYEWYFCRKRLNSSLQIV